MHKFLLIVSIGPYVEFGTGQRGAESNIERPQEVNYSAEWLGQKAQPYMSPAYLHAKNNQTVEKELVRIIQSEIRKMENSKKKKE